MSPFRGENNEDLHFESLKKGLRADSGILIPPPAAYCLDWLPLQIAVIIRFQGEQAPAQREESKSLGYPLGQYIPQPTGFDFFGVSVVPLLSHTPFSAPSVYTTLIRVPQPGLSGAYWHRPSAKVCCQNQRVRSKSSQNPANRTKIPVINQRGLRHPHSRPENGAMSSSSKGKNRDIFN